jgi:hypothetical protein
MDKLFKIHCSQIGKIMGRVGLTESQDGEELQHPSFDDFWNTFILSNSQWHQYHFTYVHNELKPFIISELNKELQGRPGDNIIVKNIAVIRGR